MSQRPSGYERKQWDRYETPAWVTAALVPHLPVGIATIWEPAAGSGKIIDALSKAGYSVSGSDITAGLDFLMSRCECDAIVTNPPYGVAQRFIERAIGMVGIVAMLLRADYDHAATRQHLFGKCTTFAKKLALTKRIVWFESPKAAPSFNHAWYIWDRHHLGPPVLAYGP